MLEIHYDRPSTEAYSDRRSEEESTARPRTVDWHGRGCVGPGWRTGLGLHLFERIPAILRLPQRFPGLKQTATGSEATIAESAKIKCSVYGMLISVSQPLHPAVGTCGTQRCSREASLDRSRGVGAHGPQGTAARVGL